MAHLHFDNKEHDHHFDIFDKVKILSKNKV